MYRRTSMFYQVLGAIASNAITQLSFQDICRLRGTCSDANKAIIDNKWIITQSFTQYIARQQSGQQSKLDAKNTIKDDMITLTESRKRYKLDDDDLKHLNYCTKYMYAYKNYMTLYRLTDIIGIAMWKHMCFTYAELMAFLDSKKRTINKTAALRQKQLEGAFTKLKMTRDQINELQDLSYTREFSMNGGIGIRRLTKLFEIYFTWKDIFEQRMKDSGEQASAYVTILVEQGLQAAMVELDIVCLRFTQKINRRKELIRELNLRGLQLRNDSRLCQEYIDGTSNRNASEIAEIMENMQFFHQHTNYAKLLRNQLDHEYAHAKQEIRELYGYISDEDEYQEALDELVNRDVISERVQAKALREYMKFGNQKYIPKHLLTKFGFDKMII